MAFLKFKKGPGKWVTLYANAIRNRLRRDKNLSDLFSYADARRNLGLTGENNNTHYHDSRYLPMLQKLKNEIVSEMKSIKLSVTGRATADEITLAPGGTVNLTLKNVRADYLYTDKALDGLNMFVAVDKFGDAVPTASEKCYYSPASDTVTFPGVKAESLEARVSVVTDTVMATKVYNALWNDYAELFPKGELTEPGDVIALDVKADKEAYGKYNGSAPAVGVHSDEFAMLIGGEQPPAGKNLYQHNKDKYIPVALAGRVRVNFIGDARKGQYVVPSKEYPGCARLFNKETDSCCDILGILIEEDNKVSKRRLKIKLK